MEAMAQEIAVLQTKAAVPTQTAEPDEPAHTVAPTRTITPATPQPTPPPARVVIPTPSGTGICGRSPEVQQAILRALSTSSCRLVSNEELYRITSSYTFGTLRSGDLAGLVKLKGLSITGNEPLPPGAFAGASIEQLNVKEAHLSPGTFNDMISIKSLNITFGESQQIPTLTDPVFAELEQLHLRFNEWRRQPDVSIPPQGNELINLKALKHFSIYANTRPDSEKLKPTDLPGTKKPFAIPASLFAANTKLETIDMNYRHQGNKGVSFQLVVPHTLVEHLHNLKKITIGQNLKIPARTFQAPPLALSPKSPLGKHLTPPDPLPEDWGNPHSYSDLNRWYYWKDNSQTLQAQVPPGN